MRLSVDEKDPGFSPEAFNAVVTLDGVEQEWAITADDVHGFVKRYVIDGDKPRVVNGRVVKEVVYGKVQIRLRVEE